SLSYTKLESDNLLEQVDKANELIDLIHKNYPVQPNFSAVKWLFRKHYSEAYELPEDRKYYNGITEAGLNPCLLDIDKLDKPFIKCKLSNGAEFFLIKMTYRTTNGSPFSGHILFFSYSPKGPVHIQDRIGLFPMTHFAENPDLEFSKSADLVLFLQKLLEEGEVVTENYMVFKVLDF
ncbi:MAG: hypothetical protein K940chlam3_01310, partial [Chlamydiae bacterium]|nr:hypothetical protein [Chlamydiota bacterium]